MHGFSLKGGLAGLALAMVFATAGCGSGSGSDEPDAKNANGLPDSINIGAQISFPPFEYYDEDGKTVLGYEPDIFNALFERLDIDANWVDAPFETLFTGLSSGRFDLLINGILIREDREELFDFVTYIEDYSTVMVNQELQDTVEDLDDLCGLTVAAVRGTTQEKWVTEQAAECTGSDKLKLLSVESDTQAKLQMKTGRADGYAAQIATVAFASKQDPGQYFVTPIKWGETLLGVAVPKDQTELRDAIRAELNDMIADGSYLKILQEWELGDGAVDESTVNPFTGTKG